MRITTCTPSSHQVRFMLTCWYFELSLAESRWLLQANQGSASLSSRIQGHLYDLLSAQGADWNLEFDVHIGTTPAHRIGALHHTRPSENSLAQKQKPKRGDDA